MTIINDFKITIRYSKNEDKLIIEDEDKNLLTVFKMIMKAVNRKYYAVTDGFHGYNFGYLNTDLVHKIEKRYPGVFEPDGDYFTTPIDIDDVLAPVWDLEDFYKEVVRLNYKDEIDGGESFEAFKKEVLK